MTNHRGAMFALTLVLCLVIPFVAACSTGQFAKVTQKGSDIAQYLKTTDIVGQLVAEKLVSPEEAEAIKTKVNEYGDSVVDFNAQVQSTVASALGFAALAPVFAGTLVRLNAIGAIPLKNPKAVEKLAKILSFVHLASSVIAAFFVVHLSQAKEIFTSKRPDALNRAVMVCNGVPYNKEKFRQARDLAQRGETDRAVCNYFGIAYVPAQLLILNEYANS